MPELRGVRILFVMAVAALAWALAPSAVQAVPRCGTFVEVPTINPGTSSNALTAIAPVGDGTAWAVGSKSSGAGEPMMLYFDGNMWTERAMPAETAGMFFSVIGNTPEGDVWLTGTRTYSVYQIEIILMRARNGAIDRIDHILNTRAPSGISASSADNVWIALPGVGALRFDGSNWEFIETPPIFTRAVYTGNVFTTGPNDVWISGTGGSLRAEYKPYVLHWDGSGWDQVSTPIDGQDQSFLRDMGGSSSADIWISGHWNYSEDLLLHWDGGAWTQHEGPAAGVALDEMAVAGDGNAWVTSYTLNPAGVFYYWDGTTWAEGASFDIPGAVTVNWRDITAAGSCEVWAVGSYHDGVTHHNLVARLEADGVVTPEVFVGAIDVTRVRDSGRSFHAEATVVVLDANLQPVAGAVVSGGFSGPTGESLVATTGVDGAAVFLSGVVNRPGDTWCFTVDDVAAEGAVHTPALNVETTDCEAEDSGGKGKGKKSLTVTMAPRIVGATGTLSFALAAEERVSLAVYDVTGRRIATLLDGVMSAGAQTVSWDTSGMSSGVYFYLLEAGREAVSGRLTVLR